MGEGFTLLLMLGGMVAVFYFLAIRPQNKRRKEQQALIGALARGDEVVTAGGIVGRVTKVDEQYVQVVVDEESSNRMTFMKSSVSSQLPKGTIKTLLKQSPSKKAEDPA